MPIPLSVPQRRHHVIMAEKPFRINPQCSLDKFSKNEHKRDYRAYRESRANETELFLELLYNLVQVVPEEPNTFGRPRLSIRDILFCLCLKVHIGFSGGRLPFFIKHIKSRGYIEREPAPNSLLNYIKSKEMNSILLELIKISSLPLVNYESNFAVDASGFTSLKYGRWVNVRTGRASARKEFRKANLMIGTKTSIITAIDVGEGHSHEAPMFPFLIRRTAQSFNVEEIYADMGYSSRTNFKIAKQIGSELYCPFKRGSSRLSRGSPTWAKMYNLFENNYDLFMRKYGRRAVVESCFSSLKRIYNGGVLRSKNPIAQNNEVLLVAIAHNLRVLIKSMYMIGVTEPDFLELSRV